MQHAIATTSARADPAAVSATLARLAGIGVWFHVVVDRPDPDDPAWHPLARLYADPATLRARIAATGRRLGTDQDRIAASVLYQALAARLWAPVLAAAAGHLPVPDLAPEGTFWQPVPAGRAPLWSPRPLGWRPGPGGLAGLVHDVVVGRHLRPLAGAIRGQVRLARGLLWGNAASALAGALAALVAARPDLAASATGLTRRLLAAEPLTGTGELVPPDPGEGPTHPDPNPGAGPARPGPGGGPACRFIRRSCCLFYRVPGGSHCRDCALLEDGRHGRATP